MMEIELAPGVAVASNLAALFLLGPLAETAFRLWGHPQGRFVIPRGGLCVGLILVIGGWLMADKIIPGAVSHSATNAGSDLLETTTAVVGLTITGLTGLAVVAAWRALDEATRAADKAVLASGAADRSIEHLAKTVRQHAYQIYQAAAYAESLDRMRSISLIPELRSAQLEAQVLANILSSPDPVKIAEAASNYVDDEKMKGVFENMGPSAARLFEHLSRQEDLSSEVHAIAYKVLALVPKHLLE